MQEASDDLEFEKAIEYRNILSDIDKMNQVQRVTGQDEGNRDVIGAAMKDGAAVVQVFFIRSGRLVGREHYYMGNIGDEIEENGSIADGTAESGKGTNGIEESGKDINETAVRKRNDSFEENQGLGEILNEFVKQFYAGVPVIPKEVLLSEEIAEAKLIEEWLAQKAGFKVSLRFPKRGDKEGLIKLACSNAAGVLERDAERLKSEQKRSTGAIAQLGELLGIELPVRIEAYDISHISGFETVGSMVVYENGKPKRSDYRKFKIRTVTGPDDYASLAEVLTRRFEHGRRELQEAGPESSFAKFPDLIMMDGGKGQVNVALEVFEKLGIDQKVCGLVKDDNHRTRGIYFNNIELPVDNGAEYFKFMTRVQDEVHRFAIEYHRKLRSKEQVHSILDDIKGIGPARRRALMMHFKSLEDIRNATVEELAACENMNTAAAKTVYEFFHETKKSEDQ
ncbi:MAG: excinuclease ABC subunit UvrC [Lachnospiraceae bacterium]|nr:excinuclease ABC subunit UvrC [Lachnospiraceae bacterium]